LYIARETGMTETEAFTKRENLSLKDASIMPSQVFITNAKDNMKKGFSVYIYYIAVIQIRRTHESYFHKQ